MIARTWNALATPSGARDYTEHFTNRVLPHLRTQAGFQSAYLLKRDKGDLIGLTVLTLWESMEAITAYTGHDPDAADIDAHALTMLLDYDSDATHHQIAAASKTPSPAPNARKHLSARRDGDSGGDLN